MGLTNTTLSAAVTASDTRLPVTSSVGAIVGQPCKVENEYIGAIVAVSTQGWVDVRIRGAEGTYAAPHNALAPVQFCVTAADFPTIPIGMVNPVPPFVDQLVSYSTAGAIPAPVENTTAFLTGTAATAYTLAAPSLASDGVRLALVSQSTVAHTLNATSTSPVIATSTGGVVGTATFLAAVGSSLQLMAAKGVWNVVSNTANTFS